MNHPIPSAKVFSTATVSSLKLFVPLPRRKEVVPFGIATTHITCLTHVSPTKPNEIKTQLLISNLYKGPSRVRYDTQKYGTQVYTSRKHQKHDSNFNTEQYLDLRSGLPPKNYRQGMPRSTRRVAVQSLQVPLEHRPKSQCKALALPTPTHPAMSHKPLKK